jgi:hypothetical protein
VEGLYSERTEPETEETVSSLKRRRQTAKEGPKMMKQLMVLGVVLAAGACAVEHKTVVVADDPCTSYGFTASSADYARCQARIAEQRRLGRVAVNYGDARIMTDSQAACTSYGIPRGTAQYDRCVQNEFAARRPG